MENNSLSGSKLTLSNLVDRILANGGPKGLDLTGIDLYGVDLSAEAVAKELEHRRIELTQGVPIWVSRFVMGRSILGLNLKEAILDQANLRFANLSGIDLTHVRMRGAGFSDACLAYANLYRANLSGTRLWRTDLRHARLGRANFHKASIYRAELDGADFSHAQLDQAHMVLIDFSNAKVHRNSFGEHFLQELPGYAEFFIKESPGMAPDQQKLLGSQPLLRAQELYIGLKNSFSAQGRHSDASWAFFRERQLERIMQSPANAHHYFGQGLVKDNFVQKIGLYLYRTTTWLMLWMAELTCGYGERPLRTLGVSLAMIMGFAFLYPLTRGIQLKEGVTMRIGDYLLYSMGAFATVGFERYKITPLVEALTSLESLIGISILALLMFALGNRISR